MLNTEYKSDGVHVFRDKTGEEVGTITPYRQMSERYWVVNMKEGYPFNAMPMKSIQAAEYLILASVIEYDAINS